MKSSTKRLVAAAALAVLAASGTAWSQAVPKIVTQRQNVMKGQGRNLTAVKGYLDGKIGHKAALADAQALVASMKTIPSLFPKDTGMTAFPGKSYAKPEIWTEPAKFSAAQQNALAKAEALVVALGTGDNGKVRAAFVDLGKHGCGGCHTPFREPKKS